MVVLPIMLLGLVGAAAYVTNKKPKGELTPARETIFATAMESVQDPNDLRRLAAAFEQAGLPEQAHMLRKRADGRELPADIKDGRRDAYRQGMTLQDPLAVLKLADAFASEGSLGAASSLRQYAQQLQMAQAAGAAGTV